MATTTYRNKAYECGLCGYRVVVDEECGCAEEHVLVCCDMPMKKAAIRKPAAKKHPAKKGAKK